MFFVGHTAIAFILCYMLIRVSSLRIRKIALPSFALIMLLSIMPDVDIVFRRLGLELGHRTFTHSLILSLTVMLVILLSLLIFYHHKNEKKKIMLLFLLSVYSSSYLSHILIGDTIIGPLNIAHPFGNLYVEIGIEANSLLHIIIEFLVMVIASSIAVREYLEIKSTNQENRKEKSILFHYSKIDFWFLYPLVILAFVVSLVHLFEVSFKVDEGNTIEQLITSNDGLIFILILYVFAASLTTFIWLKSRDIGRKIN